MRESRPQLAVLLAALLLHPHLERWLSPWGIAPDFPYLLIFWIAMRRGKLPALFWGLGLGLLRDLADHDRLGASSLALSAAGYFLGFMRDRIDRSSLAMRVPLFLLGAILAQALFFLLAMDWRPGPVLLQWLKQGLPSALLSLLVYLLVLGAVFLARGGLRRFREPDGEP